MIEETPQEAWNFVVKAICKAKNGEELTPEEQAVLERCPVAFNYVARDPLTGEWVLK